ncbi:hypothetical protein VHEMI00809 [[Torrubiella] hemipterigena]|uniref:Stc1 domain-containing protein n=1 Tax=[Torrubiella] hemipterigena TaxID=1531966 RepID=A0A0A1T328_9HYPO|nr:hypothetical protein VHEMI00809 [[Torrubiella] hemipterigena]
MTCREHQAKPKDELKCAFCSTVKHLSEYSKSSRKTAEPKCRMCVAWIEIQEPQVTPGFLLNSQMSPDEERKEIRNQPLQPNDDFLLNIEDHVENVSVVDSIGHSTEFGIITDTDSRENRAASALPPHLRAKVAGAARPTPQPSSPNPSVSSRTTSIATTYISFRGWDNEGNRHRQTRRQESVASSASTAGRRDENVIGDWSHAGLNPDSETKKNDARRGAWGRPGARLTAQELRGETDWKSKVPRTPYIKREQY